MNLNQLTVEQLALGPATHPAGAESLLRSDSPQHLARHANDRPRPTAAALSALHHRHALSQQHRPLHVSLVPVAHREALLEGADVHRRLHLLATDRRRRRRVRFRRTDRPGRPTSRPPTASTSGWKKTSPPATCRTSSPSGSSTNCRSAGAARDPQRMAGRRWRAAGNSPASRAGSPAVPLAVTQATNLNAFAGFGIQRPNRVGRSRHLPLDQRSTGRWFNTTAFGQAPQFTIGNSSRNPVIGPGYQNAGPNARQDLPDHRAHSHRVPRRSVQRHQHAARSATPTSASATAAFGTITTALDPRVYEFVLKVQF